MTDERVIQMIRNAKVMISCYFKENLELPNVKTNRDKWAWKEARLL